MTSNQTRHQVKVLLCLFAAATIGACAPGLQKGQGSNKSTPSAVIFTADTVLTMDAANSTAAAVAVADGKIIAVGSVDQIKQQGLDYQFEVDDRFKDKVIMPGFIDNHLHPALAGILLPSTFITPFDWNLPGRRVHGIQGREAYLAKLKQVHEAMSDPSEMLITWGYHEYFHGSISRTDIEAISKERPIIVWQRSFHELFANSAALTKLGINQADYENHPAIDFAKGHFWETGLFAIFPKLAPVVLNPARMKRGMHMALVHAQMNGITTIADQGVPLMNLEMEMGLLQQTIFEKQSPVSMHVIGNGKTLALNGLDSALAILDDFQNRSNAQIQYLPKQVKLLADGAFYSQLMQMDEGYLDGHHGEWITPPEELKMAAEAYWQEGYQLHIHVNGDKGVNVVLDIIDGLLQQYPREDHRTVLHHYGYSAPDQARRIADLGVSVSANPYYLYALGDKYSEIGLGPERAHYISRLGDLERNNVSVSFHSDLPMAPAAPLFLATTAITRLSASGGVLGAAEKMSVEKALRAITIEAARAIQQESKIGSIEVGKMADFTVLNANPFKVDPVEIKDIGIWGTVVKGKRHKMPESDTLEPST